MVMDIASAYNILGLSSNDTISKVELTKHYRKLATECHPDKGGDHEKFVQLLQAFKLVEPCLLNDNTVSISRTTHGDLLADLGKGLGPKNGVPCGGCSGKGYTSHKVEVYQTCPHCKGHGTICADCKGTGKFTQQRSGRVVNCLSCEGTGHLNNDLLFTYADYRKYQRSMCRACWGSGHGYFEGEALEYNTCYTCKGTGETVVFNPVLQKLAILRGQLK